MNFYSVERHFPEIVWRWTSFHPTLSSYEYLPYYSRDHKSYVSITVTITITFSLNCSVRSAFSGKWCSAKRRFGKIAFGSMTIRDQDIRQNDDSEKWLSAKWCVVKLSFGWIPIQENDIRNYIVSVVSLFGNMTIRPTDIRPHNGSGNGRIGEMTFRENDVAPLRLKEIWYCLSVARDSLKTLAYHSLPKYWMQKIQNS